MRERLELHVKIQEVSHRELFEIIKTQSVETRLRWSKVEL